METGYFIRHILLQAHSWFECFGTQDDFDQMTTVFRQRKRLRLTRRNTARQKVQSRSSISRSGGIPANHGRGMEGGQAKGEHGG